MDAEREGAAAGDVVVDLERVRADVGLLDRGDAQAVGHLLHLEDGLVPHRILGLRDDVLDEVHGGLAQRTGGLAGLRVALDAAARRLRRVLVDAGALERGGIRPAGMTVLRDEPGGPVGQDLVEVGLVRIALGIEWRRPAGREDPGIVRVLGDARLDGFDHLRRRLEIQEIALQLVEPAIQQVHVRVLQAGHRHLAGLERDDLGGFSAVGLGARFRSDVDDLAVLHREDALPGTRAVDRVEVADDEEVGGFGGAEMAASEKHDQADESAERAAHRKW